MPAEGATMRRADMARMALRGARGVAVRDGLTDRARDALVSRMKRAVGDTWPTRSRRDGGGGASLAASFSTLSFSRRDCAIVDASMTDLRRPAVRSLDLLLISGEKECSWAGSMLRKDVGRQMGWGEQRLPAGVARRAEQSRLVRDGFCGDKRSEGRGERGEGRRKKEEERKQKGVTSCGGTPG